MITHSQMVDNIAGSTARVNMISTISQFLNQAVREVHSDKDGNSVLFDRNLVEDQITATSDSGQTWTPPASMQALLTVSYPDIVNYDNDIVYPKFLKPGPRINDLDYFYYRAGSYFVFSGYGATGNRINLAYYAYPGRLKYYAAGARPAEYDDIDGWTYYDLSGDGGLDYTASAANQELARNLTTNWLLTDWEDVLSWATAANVYTRAQDPRAAVHFAKYKELKQTLYTAEGATVLNPAGN